MPEFAHLLEGYRRFRAGAYSQQRERYERLAGEGQSPKLMVIACSDSRVDPSQVFDVDPGEIFVVRNVAALVPPFETSPGHHGVSAALEFAVQFLKVRQIVVMGHGMCGGCKAALTQEMHGAERGQGAARRQAQLARGVPMARGPRLRRRERVQQALRAGIVLRADEGKHRVHVAETAEAVVDVRRPGVGQGLPAAAHRAALQFYAPQQRRRIDQVGNIAGGCR